MSISVITNKKHNVFSSFHHNNDHKNIYNSFYYKRNHRIEEADNKTKITIATGSAIATLLPVLFFAKKQNGLKKITDIFKINYNLKEVLTISTTSILGGVIAGMIADKKTSKKREIDEGVFQFMNATLPTVLVGGLIKLLEDTNHYKNSKNAKLLAITTGIIAGMPCAAMISNIINDPQDKEPDRKLSLKDSFVNIDDALGALVVAKVPLVQNLHLDKIM